MTVLAEISNSAQILPAPVPMTLTNTIVADLAAQVEAYDAAFKMASAICKTQFAPKDFRGKPEDGAIAILYGSRLHLDAIQAMQNVFIIHGRPSTYAMVMKAAVSVHGYRIKTITRTAERCVVRGWKPGAAEDDYEESEWDMARVQLAGYDKTNPKYRTEPKNMLYARATAEACRMVAPEVLLGIAEIAEARDAGPEPVHVVSERVSAAELLADATAAEPPADPVVTQWTAPPAGAEPASEPVAKQDTTSPPAEDAPPVDPPMTKVQQKKVGRLFGERGITDDAAILAAIGEFLGRQLAAPADVTRDEAIRLLAHLENDPVANEAQVTRIGELLDELRITDATDRLDVVAHITGRAVGGFEQLTSREADIVLVTLADKLAGLDETAGGDQ